MREQETSSNVKYPPPIAKKYSKLVAGCGWCIYVMWQLVAICFIREITFESPVTLFDHNIVYVYFD